MLKRTPLFDTHIASGARTVDFGGWDMPVHYGSQIEEHHAVRRAAGMFDVSHMRVVDIDGAGSRDFLRHLIANDVAKLTPGKALYSCMLNAEGGVIDDLIVYWIEGTAYRMVVNAGTAEKDIAWMGLVAQKFAVTLTPRPELAMVAVQGPQARAILAQVLPSQATLIGGLKVFSGAFAAVEGAEWFIARTGYTGEDGCEIVLPAAAAPGFWTRLKAAGVAEAGLGARDTLRLEAGMNLYVQDMDESVGPLESGLAWTVDLKDAQRRFIGRDALEALQARGGLRQLVGLKLLERGVLRSHLKVLTPQGEGETTSGTYSPTLGASIALVRVPAGVAVGDTVQVELRGKLVKALVVKIPFARNGQALV